MSCDPHWTAFASALLIPVVAILGSVIAYRQWRTAQNKLKLDLFDRRLAVYDVARKFVAGIMTSGVVHDEDLYKLLGVSSSAGWLLNDDIKKYFSHELYLRAVHLQTLGKQLEVLGVGQERSANVVAQTAIKNWFMQQYEVMDSKFSPFLRLSHL